AKVKMHFSTITTFITALIHVVSITAVSAQKITSDSCVVCIQKAATMASPNCDTVTLADSIPAAGSLSPAQQSCLCPLAANDARIRSCVKPGGCLAADASLCYNTISTIKGFTPGADGASPANGAGSLMESASSKILAGAAAAGASIFVILL
ncbi:hypothetical protein BGX30_001179, partial [Mortierella sp. GBA39]